MPNTVDLYPAPPGYYWAINSRGVGYASIHLKKKIGRYSSVEVNRGTVTGERDVKSLNYRLWKMSKSIVQGMEEGPEDIRETTTPPAP